MMPGCTVPNCTNSSTKGFKLYRFPSDKERNLIWVQNCGRERGWKPTKHTCVCEVHFDESQFESHRADGLRKLKPNAIPTVFNHLPHVRTYSRKVTKSVSSQNDGKLSSGHENIIKVESNVEEVVKHSDKNVVISEEPDHTYPKIVVIEDHTGNGNSDSATMEEVFINVSVASGFDKDPEPSGKERKLQTIERLGKKGGDEYTLGTCQSRKRGRPPDYISKLHISAERKVAKTSVTEDEEMHIQDNLEDMKSAESGNFEKKQCFVCGKVVEKGLSLFTLTNTTKVYMYQKLEKIVAGHMELHLKEEGVLCSCCANLLNYMDCIEVELNMLRKAILNCFRKTFGMDFKSNNVQENSVAAVEGRETDETQNNSSSETSGTEYDPHENNVNSSQNIQESNVEDTSQQEIQCQICKFKSVYKSVMIFHLRQHLKDVYWCDFCNIPLPNDAVNWINGNPVLDVRVNGEEGMEQEIEVVESSDNPVMNSSSDLPESSNVLITVVPVSDEDTVTSKIVDAVACRNYEPDMSSVDMGIKNVESRKSTKQIRVLNEMGKIVMQEIPISDDPGEVKNSDESISQVCTFTQLSFQSKSVELEMLGKLRESTLNCDEIKVKRNREREERYQIINELGMIVLTGGDERQVINNSDVGSESSDLRVNLTPNPLTYSSEKRLSISVKDNENNGDVFGM